MRITFTKDGWSDYTSWADDRKTLRRTNDLIKEASRQPDSGSGKPKRLRGDLAGHWSRRIDREHRLVYLVPDDHLIVRRRAVPLLTALLAAVTADQLVADDRPYGVSHVATDQLSARVRR